MGEIPPVSKTKIIMIVGQKELVFQVSRVLEIFKTSEAVIRPHFILTGPSGTGKSLTINNLCKKFKLGYMEINAAGLTKEGTSGNSLSKALTPLLQFGNRPTICFVDEFDKLFISGNSNSDLAHESTNGVQNEFLKVLEADEASVFGDYGKYVMAPTKNVLFIFAGAFNGEQNISLDRLRELGIKTEFLGRVGLIFNAEPLTLDNMFGILDNSQTMQNYLKLFPDVDGEKATFELKAHIQKHFEMNTLGARMINTIIHQYFIHDGQLTTPQVEKSTFQNRLSFKSQEDEELSQY